MRNKTNETGRKISVKPILSIVLIIVAVLAISFLIDKVQEWQTQELVRECEGELTAGDAEAPNEQALAQITDAVRDVPIVASNVFRGTINGGTMALCRCPECDVQWVINKETGEVFYDLDGGCRHFTIVTDTATGQKFLTAVEPASKTAIPRPR